MEDRDQNFSPWFIGLFVAALLIFLHSLRKHRTVERLLRKRSQVMKREEIGKNVIIIAVEILNFIVVYSQSYKSYYKPIEIGNPNVLESISNFLKNKRPCYRERFQKKSIQKFFNDLKAIKNVKLFLCTRLQRKVCDKLLEKLKIQDCFQKKDRVYTQGRFISAEQIDHDTGRVIIISTNKQDQDRSVTNHHNMILDLMEDEKQRFDESILSDLKECLAQLASKGRVDTLHEDMQNLLFQKGIPIYDDEL